MGSIDVKLLIILGLFAVLIAAKLVAGTAPHQPLFRRRRRSYFAPAASPPPGENEPHKE